MLKKLNLLLLFFCLSVSAFAQTPESLKLRESELKYYEKDNLNFRYENTVEEKTAAEIDRKLRPRGKAPFVDIYRASKSSENLYLIADYDDRCSLMLYRKNGNALTKLYQSPVFRDGYNLDLSIFENENRALIIAAKREGVGDYIDTEVFELFNNQVKYLGNIPAGATDDPSLGIDSIEKKTEVSYQSGIYRIKISGKSYIPAGKRSPHKNTLVGTNVTYVYNGKVLRKEK